MSMKLLNELLRRICQEPVRLDAIIKLGITVRGGTDELLKNNE
jgi:6,7-dimethyl-8-ribityllumazine synthase